MSKYSKFITWSKTNSQHKKAVFSETVDKDGSWAEMNSDMENGCIDSKGVASAALAIAYADHCTAPLLARITELEAAQTWQPIESAPKDGTRILTIDPDFVGLHEGADVARYTGAFGGAWLDNARHIPDTVYPTHWMPLPTPPKGGSV